MKRKTATQIIQESHIKRHPRLPIVSTRWTNQVVRDGRKLEQYLVTTTTTNSYMYYFDAEMYTVVEKLPFKRASVAV